MPTAVDLGAGYLTINSVPLATPAWRITDLTPLFDAPKQRGDDLVIPGAAGVLARPRRNTATRIAFVIEVFGELDSDGVAHANPALGLITNIDYLYTNVVAPPGTATGTRAAEWTLPGGETRNADVHVLGLTFLRRSPTWARGRLDVNVPAGRFA